MLLGRQLVCVIFILISSVSIRSLATLQMVNIKYLGGVHRLNNTNYTDYYFSCNVHGLFLQWQYINEPLSGFLVGDVGRVHLDERPNYEYTSTLLSSQPDSNDTRQATLDSVLVLSFENWIPSQFEVTCSSHLNHSTSMTRNLTTVNNSTGGDIGNNTGIVLNYVLSSHIVQSRINTHIFVCGAPFMLQFLEVNGPPIGFSEHDYVGLARTVLTNDNNIANVQGILIARKPYQTTTLLFVAEDSDVVVTCFDGTRQAALSSNSFREEPITSAPPTTETESITSGLHINATSSVDGNEVTVDIIVIFIPLFLVIIVFILLTYVCTTCYFKMRKRKSSCFSIQEIEENGSQKEKLKGTLVLGAQFSWGRLLPGKKKSSFRDVIKRFLPSSNDEDDTLHPLTERFEKPMQYRSTQRFHSLYRNDRKVTVHAAQEDLEKEPAKENESDISDGFVFLNRKGSSQSLRNLEFTKNLSAAKSNVSDSTKAELTAGSYSKVVIVSDTEQAMYSVLYKQHSDEDSTTEDLCFDDTPEMEPDVEQSSTAADVVRKRLNVGQNQPGSGRSGNASN